jgi:hypothetical protein
MEFAHRIDEHGSLERLFGQGVVADGVVGEVVEDFHCEEEARDWHDDVPFEDRLIDDLYF